MRNKIKVKICGIKNNIQNIIDLYPDFIGFIFYKKSPRFVGNNFSISGIDFRNTLKVGVFVNENPNVIKSIYKQIKLDFVQLHGSESPEFCKLLFQQGLRVIKSFKLDSIFIIQKLINYIPFCSYFLFDNNGGSGQKFIWDKLNEYNFSTPFFLSGGITIYDIDTIKNLIHPSMIGVDINSKFEFYPGKKNIQKLEIFIKKLNNKI